MFCSNCGARVEEDANFCMNCGNKLQENPNENKEENFNQNKKYKSENENDIREYAENLGISLDNNFVTAYKDPSFKSFFFLGSLSILSSMKHFIVAFTSEEIILFGLTITGKFADLNTKIPRKEIESIEIKNGILQYKMILKLKDEDKIALKITKATLAMKWQKRNVQYLVNHDWFN